MGFDPQGTIPVVTRYVAAARRSLDKSLQMLLQMQKEVESAEALETESAGAKPTVLLPTPQRRHCRLLRR